MFGILREFLDRRYVRRLKSRGLTLGERVYLNDGFFIDPSHFYLIVIEDDVTFGPRVCLLAHDASTKKVLGKTLIAPIRIRRNAFLGANVTVLPGCQIGANSIVGAGAVVTESIPDDEVWAGVPARKLMSVNEYRERLEGQGGADFRGVEFSAPCLSQENLTQILSATAKHGRAYLANE